MNFLKKHKFILLLLLAAIFLRAIIYLQIMNKVPFSDYFDYRQWVFNSVSLGLNKVYFLTADKRFPLDIDQPPGSMYILRGSYEVFLVTAKAFTHFLHLNPGSTLWINDNLMIFFFRLPSLIADIILGWLLYVFVKSKANEKMGLLASGLFLFGPQIIYNSTVWGQMDAINNLFFYISLIFLFRKNTFLSILFYGLSLFVKVSLLPLLPVYLLIGFGGKFFTFKKFLISLIIIICLFIVLILPFFPNPMQFIAFMSHAAGGRSNDITVKALNFWWFLFNPLWAKSSPPSWNMFLGLSLGSWGNLLFGALYIPVLVYVWKLIKNKNLSAENIFFAFFLIAFATFLFLPKMHERYLYPIFPLLITYVCLKAKYWIWLITLSIIHFLNLYIVWNPTLFLFGKYETMLRWQENIWQLSFLTLLIFIIFYLQFIYSLKMPQKIKYD
ncbi:MAG TPA: hypothetical protein VF820_05045 [Patescibacteria group bacterium]